MGAGPRCSGNHLDPAARGRPCRSVADDATEHLVSQVLAESWIGRVGAGHRAPQHRKQQTAARPIRPQPAEAAAAETIAAFLKHRPVHIPGRLMRIMTRLIPRSLSVRMNGRMLGQAARTLAERQAAPAG